MEDGLRIQIDTMTQLSAVRERQFAKVCATRDELLAEARITVGFLTGLADQLDQWAKESREGGWSTHQVQKNIDTANDCRRRASLIQRGIAKATGVA